MSSHNLSINSLNPRINYRNTIRFRRRWESFRTSGQSVENNLRSHISSNSINENEENYNPRNTISNTIDVNSNIIQNIQNGNLSTRQNNIRINNENPNNTISNFGRIRTRNIGRRINQNLYISIYHKKNKKLNEIEEEEKKKEEVCTEENIGSEIKDTVKCYICFDKITKPKMCPHCHRIACEKCLYNWFVNLRKTKCGFCRENTKFTEMVSVPFMDAVVNFVEKFFNKKKEVTNTIDNEFLEYCPEHKNEMLYYYCLDCGKPYCKTCFVFFGEEKDKHNGHSIIEYEKYKNMSMPLLKKNTEKLESNIQHVEENIKRCLAYKTSYEYERKIGNKFLKNLQNEFNKQIDEIISKIDDKIKQLKEYIYEYNKYKKEVDYFYGDIRTKYKMKKNNDKSCESLIIKLSKINQEKFFSSKEIEKLSELSKKIRVNTYQSKVGEFNHESMFLSRGLKMGTSPYELVIDNKQRNEVQISLTIPKDKKYNNHNFQAFILIRLKGECVQTYDLDEYKEDYKNYYLIKKIPWDYFGQSIFRIKGMLYEYYFE